MLKNKFYRKLLVVGITGTLIISSSLIAFASSSKSTTTTKTNIGVNSFGGPQGQKGDMQRGNPLAVVLKAQVTAKVITQSQSDKITAFLKTKEAAEKVTRAAEKTKLDAMTDAQRQTYMEANKPVRGNMIAELVTAKLLTQAQATKIQASMPQKSEVEKGQGGQFGKAREGMQQGNPIAAILKAQVTAKTITQADSDKVTAFLKTKEDAKKVEMTAQKAKLDAMTDAQREAYMKTNRPEQSNIFADLVTADILTQAQADKIKASMPQKPQMGNVNGQGPAVDTKTTATVTK